VFATSVVPHKEKEMIWLSIVIGIILLFVFPKQVGVLLGVITVGCGVIYLYFEAENRERQKQIDAVTVAVSFSQGSCTSEFPIFVKIKNGSRSVVEKVSWNLSAHKNGYSSNVIDYGNSGRYSTPYSSDKILNSGQSFSVCYRVPTLSGKLDPKALNWSAISKSINFKKN